MKEILQVIRDRVSGLSLDWRPEFGDLRAGMGLLTCIPTGPSDHGRLANSAWAWPVIGMMLGASAGFVAFLMVVAGASPGTGAFLGLALLLAATGAIHEDGLADTADGFWGGRNRADRLKIMHDSSVGTFGTVAVVLALLGRWMAIGEQASSWQVITALAVAAALSRAAMAVSLQLSSSARDDGLVERLGKPSYHVTLAGSLVAVTIAILLSGLAGLLAAILAGFVVLAAGRLARNRIGGQTGDTLGSVQQCVELSVLLLFAWLH